MLLTLSRSIHLLILVTATSLIGCGEGSVKDPYSAPSYAGGTTAATHATASVIVFGDAMSDLTTGMQYTVNNDAGINNWAVQVASSYSVSSFGIKSYARGNALVSDIAAQVSSAGTNYGHDPLVLMSGGYRDIINAAEAGTSAAVAIAAARTAGTAYANAARSVAARGAKHVLVMNLLDMGQTPYQTLGGRSATTHPLNLMIRAFNDALKSNLGDSTQTYIGDTIRLANAESYMGGLLASLTANGFTDATTMVCATTANDLGIAGTLLSAKACTTSTLNAAATPVAITATNYNNYIFADPLNLTPAAQRSLGIGMRSFANW